MTKDLDVDKIIYQLLTYQDAPGKQVCFDAGPIACQLLVKHNYIHVVR